MISKPLVRPSILICEEKINLTYALNWKRPVIHKKSNSQQHTYCRSFSLHDSDQQTEAEQLSALWVPKLHTIAELSTEFLKKLRPRFQSISSKHCNRKWDTAFLVQHWRHNHSKGYQEVYPLVRPRLWKHQDSRLPGILKASWLSFCGAKEPNLCLLAECFEWLSFAGKHPGRLHTPSLFCTTACSSASWNKQISCSFQCDI